MPSKVTFGNGNTITYLYAFDGTKLRTVHKAGSTTTTTDYCGNVVYENGTQKLLLTEEGYVTLADSKYHYYLKDHQGNNRVVISQSGTVEETNHYYPFGGVFAAANNVQPYKYNGKEFDTKNGLNWYDYGARHYDAALGRWHAVDPNIKNNVEMTPYAYCFNNPLKYKDPDGKDGVISICGNNITVRSNIIIYGKDASSQLARIYKSGIMGTWGKETIYKYNGTTYNILWDVNVRVATPQEKFDFNGVNNYIEVSMEKNTSYVTNYNRGLFRGRNRIGNSLQEDNPAPHEFGHLLGLSDKYKNKRIPISKEWEGNIMASPNGNVDKRNLDALFQDRLKQFEQRSIFWKMLEWIIPWDIKYNYYINKENREK